MSDIKLAYGAATAFTKTNANLTSSTTAGWRSNAIDNTSGKYIDALVEIELAAVNSAPAGSKAVFLFAYALVDPGAAAYTSSGDTVPDGAEGTLTFPAVTTLPSPMPTLGVVPYPVQNKALNGGPFSVAKCFGGILPPKWGVAMVNDSGMTISVTNVKYTEVYQTVI
jgi:hypothetical protein